MLRLAFPAALLLLPLLTAVPPARAQSPKAAKPAPAPAKAKTSTAKAGGAKASATPKLAPVGGMAPEARATQMTGQMRAALGLSPKQTEQVQAINLRSIQNVEDAHNQHIHNLPKMHQQVELIGASRLAQLKDVLTEEQFRTYSALREKKMGIPQQLQQQAAAAERAGSE